MKDLGDLLITILVIGGVLIVPFILTNAFTRWMYYKCGACGALNAKRRSECRLCGEELLVRKI